MSYLLDTHTFLWFLEGNKNLSSNARIIIENPNNTIFVSIASIWEIAIKTSLNKLKLSVNLEEVKTEIVKNNFEILPLDFEHIIELTNLEQIHKDPFDRIIISQAISEKYTIISKDSNFGFYKNVNILW
jgi:PIN domain nuclease of toxin-antitoxin system